MRLLLTTVKSEETWPREKVKQGHQRKDSVFTGRDDDTGVL